MPNFSLISSLALSHHDFLQSENHVRVLSCTQRSHKTRRQLFSLWMLFFASLSFWSFVMKQLFTWNNRFSECLELACYRVVFCVVYAIFSIMCFDVISGCFFDVMNDYFAFAMLWFSSILFSWIGKLRMNLFGFLVFFFERYLISVIFVNMRNYVENFWNATKSPKTLDVLLCGFSMSSLYEWKFTILLLYSRYFAWINLKILIWIFFRKIEAQTKF